MVKAVSLLSGGLDSVLATKLILDQRIEIEAVHFSTVFTGKNKKNYFVSKDLADKLDILLTRTVDSIVDKEKISSHLKNLEYKVKNYGRDNLITEFVDYF